VKSVLVDRGDQFGVSAVVFDGQEEMLWMGNAGVSISVILSFNNSCSCIDDSNNNNNNNNGLIYNAHNVEEILNWRCD